MTAPATAPQGTHPTPLNRAALPGGMWSAPTTFRHGQCDPAGIVYTPQFFDIFNQTVERWFSERLGLDYYDLIGARRTGLGYVTASANFFEPCKMGETVDIFVDVSHIGTKSYALVLHAMKGDAEALRGMFTTVTTALDTNKAKDIPQDLKSALTGYAESLDRN